MTTSTFRSRLGNKHAADSLSEGVYMFVLGLYVTGGLLLSAMMAALSYNWQLSLPIVLVIGIVLPLIGIFLSAGSENWLVSSCGYLMVLIPLGLLLGPAVAMYKAPVVIQAVVVTVLVAGGMWLLGSLVPAITTDWGGYIIAALLVLIAGDAARMIMPSFGLQPTVMGIWPWVGTFLFAGLIVYDINKAMQMPKTLDNAVDGAVGLYLDIVNIFLRLLEIFGGSSKD